jgi:hypothetical protein
LRRVQKGRKYGKRKKVAQKENGQAQTPQTAQKDAVAETSEK